MRSGASLTATDVTRAHGAFVVLAGVSLTVGPRSRIGVVGPNGVGKTPSSGSWPGWNRRTPAG